MGLGTSSHPACPDAGNPSRPVTREARANLVYFSETKCPTNFRSTLPSLRAHTDIEETSTHTSSKATKEKSTDKQRVKEYPATCPPQSTRLPVHRTTPVVNRADNSAKEKLKKGLHLDCEGEVT